jgi:predicted TIM-barrel fold metal-dependent hydrolase
MVAGTQSAELGGLRYENGNGRYSLVSADSHVIEPGDLWTSRLPSRFRDRAPHITRFPQGDAWVLAGVDEPITFGFNAAAGTDVQTLAPWKRWEEIDAAGYDPVARVRAMDADGVDAEVLYPTPRLAQYLANVPDDDFHVALVHAYNDWLPSYCSYDVGRLGGIAIATNRGAHRTVTELEAAVTQRGIVGVLLSSYPNGSLSPTEEDDEFWAWAEAREIAVSIHISLTGTLPEERRTKALGGAFRLSDAPDRLDQLIFSGVLDRFPRLRLVFAEVDCGWVPYYREQLENSFRRMGSRPAFGIERTPTQYLDDNIYFTFITDSFGIRNRNIVGVDRMLWSSDYPHNASDWPHSWRTINAAMSDVAPGERHQILAGNALSLYRFD